MAGDQHVLGEDFFFQRCAGSGVDAPGQAQVLGLLAVQLPVMTRQTQGLAVMAVISASALSLLRRVVPRAKVVPSKPRAWAACSSGDWVKMARRSVP
jgi:hypothetical protein